MAMAAGGTWYKLNHPEQVASPALLVYPERIEKNILAMLAIAGGADRLRPHIKTHKTAEIIQMQMSHGIGKFKCATIAEAELLATCGAKDILLAMQPVGPNIERFLRLMECYPASGFATLADNAGTIRQISVKARSAGKKVALYLDLNTGMNRTGIAPGEEAALLFKMIADDPCLEAAGLHAYDGHIRERDPSVMKEKCDAAFDGVLALKHRIEQQGMHPGTVVAGGSPTYPIHAARRDVELSPGTTLLWDETYASWFKDMPFLPAAVLLTRIISKPRSGVICLDLGHKSVAPEMPFPRVKIPGMEHCTQTGQSEEHLVVECPGDHGFEVGDVCYAIPMHICPTVAKYPVLITVLNGEVTGSWTVAARDHALII